MNITLKFAKRELKCSLGLLFLGEFLDDMDMSLEEVGEKMQKNPFRLLPKMIYISAKTEAEMNDEDFDLTLKDVVGLMEKDGGISSPQVVKFINAWTSSLTDGVPKQPAEEGAGEAKK
jgi:hypothetical protein